MNIHHLLIEWYWKLWIRPWAYRIGAVCLGLLSVVIVWCELTFGIPKVTLSLFAQVVYALHSFGNYIAVEVGFRTVGCIVSYV